jgi:two-component system torCAD operon response regulator TorR
MANVLIVGNDSTGAQTAEQECRSAGHCVTIARHGTDAMVRLARDAFDMVVIDARMPGKEGIALIRALRAHQDYARLPTLVVAARSESRDHHELLASGAHRVLPGGCCSDEVKQALAELSAAGR